MQRVWLEFRHSIDKPRQERSERNAPRLTIVPGAEMRIIDRENGNFSHVQAHLPDIYKRQYITRQSILCQIFNLIF